MTIRKILTMDQPVLRAKAKKVSRFDNYLERLVNDMWETMREAPGVGLAAPQIGESIRVLVAEFEDNAVALVNPEIIKRSDEMEYGTEGCLSIPGLVGDDVPRHAAITVKGRDPKGKEIRVKAEGWWARVLQHEIDHLDGILYIDHIPPEKVREVQPDEIADEAEVRHEHVKETIAGESEPIRRATLTATSDSGKNGNRQTAATAKSGRIGNQGEEKNTNSSKNGNPGRSPRRTDVGAQPAAPAVGERPDSSKNGNRPGSPLPAGAARAAGSDDVGAQRAESGAAGSGERSTTGERA